MNYTHLNKFYYRVLRSSLLYCPSVCRLIRYEQCLKMQEGQGYGANHYINNKCLYCDRGKYIRGLFYGTEKEKK